MGLPTHTVAGIIELAASGGLDGRFAAVAGYWAQFALPCPYMPHQPVILGFCSGGSFADTAEEARAMGGNNVNNPGQITVPESANGGILWTLSGFGDAGRVVLVVHAADSREWQCDAASRTGCHARLIIDSVAWANGAPLALEPQNSELTDQPVMTLAQVAAAAVGPGEQLVTAYPLLTTDLNEVDPRFSGNGHGIVWYVRVISGVADADATAEGKDVLVNDEDGDAVMTLPLSVDPAFTAARVILDSQGWEGAGDARPRFRVLDDAGVIVADESLDSSASPLALPPGGYTVVAYVGGPVHAGVPPAGDSLCDQQLPLIAGDDVAYYADFTNANDCTWKVGDLFL